MFVSLKEFAEEWKNEAVATQRILETLTDESLQQRVAKEHFSLGQLSWHLTVAVYNIMSQTGLSIESPGKQEDMPASAKEIANAYERISNVMLEAMMTEWTDKTLEESRMMFGQEWSIQMTLRALIQHQTHHRGQMTVLMRQAGLRVPGMYGPSKEEWAEMGMVSPQV